MEKTASKALKDANTALQTDKSTLTLIKERAQSTGMQIKEDVEKKKQAFSALKIKYNDEINKLKRLQSQKEEKR